MFDGRESELKDEEEIKPNSSLLVFYFILFYFILFLGFIFGDNDRPMSGERALI